MAIHPPRFRVGAVAVTGSIFSGLTWTPVPDLPNTSGGLCCHLALISLSVCDVGTGFIACPRLGMVALRQWTDFGVLHDHASAGIPSQNGIVIPGYREIHGFFVVAHGFAQGVVDRGSTPGAELSDAGVAQTLPDNSRVVCLLVVAFELSEHFLSFLRRHIRLELVGPR